MHKSNPAISRLIDPISYDAFRADYWEKKPLTIHGTTERFQSLTAIPALHDVYSLLAAYPSPVMVIGKVAIRETEGLSDRMLVDPKTAAGFFEEGATLELDCVDMHIDEVRQFVANLCTSLELPAGTFPKAIVYVSSPGSGVSPHFDAYVNFVFQLSGRKTWYLLENTNAPAPAEHYDLNEYPYLPEELRGYWDGEAPTDYRASAEPVTLGPGSMLYVPRGHWHSTNTLEASISVHVTYSVPSWFDLAVAAVRRKLVGKLEWRELASASVADARIPQLSNLLAEMKEEINAISVEDLAAHLNEPHDKYQLANAVFRQVLRLPSAGLVSTPYSPMLQHDPISATLSAPTAPIASV